MNLNENFPVSAAKVEELKNRIKKLNIAVDKIEEQFVRGSGHGGQKINKTSNCVMLKYPPLNMIVKMQQDRQRSVNRFLALRELVDKIEMEISPETSRRLKDFEKIRKQKAKHSKRSMAKYASKEEDMLTKDSLKIKVEKITPEKMLELGIPSKPAGTGVWSVWECPPKTFDWEYSSTENAYVYEGKVKVKSALEEVEIKAGDYVSFPKGLKCTWTVLEKIRKVYSFEG